MTLPSTAANFASQNTTETPQAPTPNQELQRACTENDFEGFIMALRLDADIDAPNEDGDPPLIIAVNQEEPNYDLIRHLLELGADVSIRGALQLDALYRACERDNYESVLLLLEHRADSSLEYARHTNLLWLVTVEQKPNRIAIAKQLIRYGADASVLDQLSNKSLLREALERNDEELGKVFIEQEVEAGELSPVLQARLNEWKNPTPPDA